MAESKSVLENYLDMEMALLSWGAVEVSAFDVYSDVFHVGDGLIQRVNQEKGNYMGNPLAYFKNDNEKNGHYRVIFEDTLETIIPELQDADFSIINGLSYFGRKNVLSMADRMFAMVFDLDGLTGRTLYNFLYAAIQSADFDHFPIPNYVVLSGHGVHLYYVFEEPVKLYTESVKAELKELKYALTRKMWNPEISKVKPQYQGINQGFRVIGGKTKIEGIRARAFQINTHPVSVEYLKRFVATSERVEPQKKLKKKAKYSLAQARKLFPDWYRDVIEDGCARDGHIAFSPRIYEWWKRKIQDPINGAAFGHRYYCLMMLAVYGCKCGVDKETIMKDALGLVAFMNSVSPDNPFTEQDAIDAVNAYDKELYNMKRETISRYSGIDIQPQRRNYRKQKMHLKIARNILEMTNEENGYALQGRPSKSGEIREWRENNPNGRKIDCIRETGISPKTVYKYWEDVHNERMEDGKLLDRIKNNKRLETRVQTDWENRNGAIDYETFIKIREAVLQPVTGEQFEERMKEITAMLRRCEEEREARQRSSHEAELGTEK